ncbi:hypothetical protein pb186bvf_004806 [Paramecium bursaria]
MPPKKDNKKELVLTEDDGSGILKNIVQFTLKFQVVQLVTETPPNLVIMYEWINATQVERLDTGLIETWTIASQIEKSEDPEQPPPQITYSFEKIFDPIRFNEPLAEILSTRKLFLYFIYADDMKVLHEFQFDYSKMLREPKFEYKYSKMKIMEILDFEYSLTANKPLLSDQLSKILNPFSVEIVHCVNVPVQDMKSYELCYVRYQFYNGDIIQTDAIVAMPEMYFYSVHVFLLGDKPLKQKFLEPIKFELHDKDEIVINDLKAEVPLFDIEKWLQVEAEKEKPPEPVDLIDPKTGKKIPRKEEKKDVKKEVKKEVKKDAKKDNKKKEIKLGEPIKEQQQQKQFNRNNYGVATFNLSAFIHKNVHELDLIAQIVPKKQFEDTESGNLDLNTTARKNAPKVFADLNYFDEYATMYVKFDMASPLKQ